MDGAARHVLRRTGDGVTRLDVLRELIELESPSDDRQACNVLADRLADILSAAGGQVVRHQQADRGDHLEARFDAGHGKPALVLCHYDTVWPLGTTAARPFRIAEVGVEPGGDRKPDDTVAEEFEALIVGSAGARVSERAGDQLGIFEMVSEGGLGPVAGRVGHAS